jgi:signal transduction histidine kinase
VEAQVGDVEGLPAAVDLAAYRIVSEALSNAVRHGGATAILVRLQRERDWLRVEVSDDGTGIEPDAVPGVGLASMRARAEELGGSFSVRGSAGIPAEISEAERRGTTITALLPLSVEEENE